MLEVEKKFIAKADMYKIAAQVPDSCGDCIMHIDQGYLIAHEKFEWRIRSVRFGGFRPDPDSYRTALKIGNGFARREYEAEIPRWLFTLLRPFASMLSKTRYDVGREYLGSGGWSVDFFHGNLAPLVLAEHEHELSKEEVLYDDFVLPLTPPGLSIGEDVTESRRFANKRLAVLDAGAQREIARENSY